MLFRWEKCIEILFIRLKKSIFALEARRNHTKQKESGAIPNSFNL